MRFIGAAILRRVMNSLDSSESLRSEFLRSMSWLHLHIYRLSRGFITIPLFHDSEMILLTSTGRRSGKLRTVPLLTLKNGNEWLVVASHGGLLRPPGWWFNLQQNPRCSIQVGRRKFSVIAETARDGRRSELWKLFEMEFRGYTDFRGERQGGFLSLSSARRAIDAESDSSGAGAHLMLSQ